MLILLVSFLAAVAMLLAGWQTISAIRFRAELRNARALTSEVVCSYIEMELQPLLSEWNDIAPSDFTFKVSRNYDDRLSVVAVSRKAGLETEKVIEFRLTVTTTRGVVVTLERLIPQTQQVMFTSNHALHEVRQALHAMHSVMIRVRILAMTG